MARIPMSRKEVEEGYRAGIPYQIMGRISQGFEIADRDKEIVRQHGKVYVESHKRDGKWIKPQLRNLPNDSRPIRPIPKKVVDKEIINHYLVTALWSSTDDDTDEPFDANYNISDFDKESVREVEKDLEKFIKEAGRLLDKVDDKSQIGHDFWLTRNHHGAGFWDRPEVYGEEEAKKLTEIATKFPEKYLFAEGGKVHIE